MTGRIDYYDDPAAPTANSLVPSVNVVVVNGEDERSASMLGWCSRSLGSLSACVCLVAANSGLSLTVSNGGSISRSGHDRLWRNAWG
jgi:hypothetical protein